jgi:hypothetical protein
MLTRKGHSASSWPKDASRHESKNFLGGLYRPKPSAAHSGKGEVLQVGAVRPAPVGRCLRERFPRTMNLKNSVGVALHLAPGPCCVRFLAETGREQRAAREGRGVSQWSRLLRALRQLHGGPVKLHVPGERLDDLLKSSPSWTRARATHVRRALEGSPRRASGAHARNLQDSASRSSWPQQEHSARAKPHDEMARTRRGSARFGRPHALGSARMASQRQANRPARSTDWSGASRGSKPCSRTPILDWAESRGCWRDPRNCSSACTITSSERDVKSMPFAGAGTC